MPGRLFCILMIVVAWSCAGSASAGWLDHREEHRIVPYADVKGWEVYAIGQSYEGFLGCGAIRTEAAGELVIERYMGHWQLVVPTGRSDEDRYDGALVLYGIRTEFTGARRLVHFEGGTALGFPFDLYWIDPDGAWLLYTRLVPGQGMDMETYVGHQWVARLDDNECAYAEITPRLSTVVFQYEDD
ncbi:hypothetical protein [Martelella endophytica]|uniref:von Hippel-Lindau disease tumour suppressor beta domain-containing protein n=1 Tax=Martelella endophytica TaxID=1486262 RepID=A0A0D5LUQ5_MAREN|nr:hypothetical protein [Martelella endophytica]AJY47705.1 hypothetical protein TM49_21765 [Martelella endophytica]